MTIYRVNYRQVSTLSVDVEAESEEEAQMRAENLLDTGPAHVYEDDYDLELLEAYEITKSHHYWQGGPEGKWVEDKSA